MALCKMAQDAAGEGFTSVDNRFIREYMPEADGDKIKVYLLGLHLCSSSAQYDNTLEHFCNVLDMTAAQVADSFAYWRDQGLVTIVSQDPLEVRYNRLSQSSKTYKVGKFTDFNTQLQRIFQDRMLLQSEYLKYYEFLDETHLPQDALLLIAAYCVRIKGDDIRPNYVLTVARSWFALGIRSVADVEKHIELEEASTGSLRAIAKELGKRSAIDLDDRQLYVKWTSSWGFSDQAVLTAAKLCKKRGGMERLDSLLNELFVNNRLDPQEITDYAERKRELYDLAKEITRIIGVRYENLDTVISHYISAWTAQGFDRDALIQIAEYCFSTGVRTLAGMNAATARFAKQGCLNVRSINEYLASLVERDKLVKQVIEASGSSRNVTASDRDSYSLWQEWGFGHDAIVAAAKRFVGRPLAFGQIAKALADCRDRKIFDSRGVDAAIASAPSGAKSAPVQGAEMEHKYSKEELNSFFGDLSSFNDSEV